ncbi:MAG: RsmB/NOP family class I SAM-dependent RNA methyltransferase [Pseudomonadota bacterium]
MLAEQQRAVSRRRVTARSVALDVLDAVFTSRPRPADEVFQKHPGLARLETRDRAFAKLLYTTALRHLGEIDRAWRDHVKYRPRDARAINVLRLGAAQLLFLSTPAHAAVSETVGLATGSHHKQASMINAVLRRIAKTGSSVLEKLDPVALNTPRWMLESWKSAYGVERAQAIAASSLIEPPLDLNPKNNGAYWATAIGGDLLPNGIIRRRTGSVVEALPGFAEGAWWVQDAAAALPVFCLGNVSGRSVLEIGAAPGGKTAQLVAMGAKVTAVERSPARAEILARNLARLQQEVEIVVADATEWRTSSQYDFILLDAPCTATGTIRRHPDILWTKSPKDLVRLEQAQSALLNAAVAMLAPDGKLVFATCSLQSEEGEKKIIQLVESRNDIEVEPILDHEAKGLPIETGAFGSIRTFPYAWEDRGGLDGFFICRIRKRRT